jgi:hypothetical protein
LLKERKTKFALLSLLSALAIVSTAFAGVSIYAQTDDNSELTTFEEAIAAGSEENETGVVEDTAESDKATDGEISAADVSSLFDGL